MVAAPTPLDALVALLNRYVDLVQHGAGIWDTDKDPVVIDARAAIAAHEASKVQADPTDTQRLDWMQSHKVEVIQSMTREWVVDIYGGPDAYGDTLRAAIDAAIDAMQATKEQQ